MKYFTPDIAEVCGRPNDDQLLRQGQLEILTQIGVLSEKV